MNGFLRYLLGKLKKTASQTCHKKSLDENFKTKTSQKFAVEREREGERERERQQQ